MFYTYNSLVRVLADISTGVNKQMSHDIGVKGGRATKVSSLKMDNRNKGEIQTVTLKPQCASFLFLFLNFYAQFSSVTLFFR